ncbi:MAG: hypothetical protein ACLQUT_06800 [Thermoleophilia bacterium]
MRVPTYARIRRSLRSADEQSAEFRSQWGVATCDHCGSIVMLGEDARVHRRVTGVSLCLSCQALPCAPPTPRAERIQIGVDGGSITHTKRRAHEQLSDAA